MVREWFVDRKDLVILLVSVVSSLVLIFSSDDSQIHFLRAWALGSFGVILDEVTSVEKYSDVYEQNVWLRDQNASLMLENSRLKEAAVENARLRSLLSFKTKSQLQLIPARVVGMNESGFINSIVLDVGKADSIAVNMTIVTAQGVAGKVYQVDEHFAIAQLLLDRNFRVGAMVQRSRTMGIMRWATGSQVVLAAVPKRSDVVVGDSVVTTGLSTIFPGGLQIGRVVEVNEDEQGMFMNVAVQPTVDFSKLEEVFVVKMQPLLSE